MSFLLRSLRTAITLTLALLLAETVAVTIPNDAGATGIRYLITVSALAAAENAEDDLPPPKSPPKDPKGGSPKSVQAQRAEISVFANGTVGIVALNGRTLLAPSRMTVGTNGLISVNGRPWAVMNSEGTIVIGLKRSSGAPHAGKLSQLRTALASVAAAKNAVNRPPSGGLLGGGSPSFGSQGPAATGRPAAPPKPSIIY